MRHAALAELRCAAVAVACAALHFRVGGCVSRTQYNVSLLRFPATLVAIAPVPRRTWPFCGDILRVVPDTSARSLVLAVPCRRFASCQITTRCTMSRRRGTSKIRPGSWASPTGRPSQL